jgi:N-acetylmuramic acid 6-phosphate etherase
MLHLTTEQTNPSSTQIDSLDSLGIVTVMNAEDHLIASAVRAVLPEISQCVDIIADRLAAGGRLVYVGAGTSGRLGVLDASECPPTFNTPPEMVVGIIAGGDRALRTPIEGAEDSPDACVMDLQRIDFGPGDVLVGIASSGRTPYVIGGLQLARSLGAVTIGLTCNRDSELNHYADHVLAPIVGPEIVSGSTRLKSGTATKMVLNMLTTATMIMLGKTYGNWMVDLRATNIKLKARSVRIVASIAEVPAETAQELLESCDGEVKTAIVMSKLNMDSSQARKKIAEAKGKLRAALQ